MPQDNAIDINKYRELKSYLDLILEQLNSCLIYLENASDICKSNYTLDDYSEEGHIIMNKKEYLEHMRDDLRNIVIPQVENMSQVRVSIQ